MDVGLRALKQNPAAAVQAAAAGELVLITNRGRPTAQMLPISTSPLADLRAAGLVREARRSTAELPEPMLGLALSASLSDLRAGERS